MRESKYGIALVLETSEFSGSYVLGFRVDKLDEVYNELSSLFMTYSKKPVFGVQCQFDEHEVNVKIVKIPHQDDIMEIVDTGYEHVGKVQKIYAEQKKSN